MSCYIRKKRKKKEKKNRGEKNKRAGSNRNAGARALIEIFFVFFFSSIDKMEKKNDCFVFVKRILLFAAKSITTATAGWFILNNSISIWFCRADSRRQINSQKIHFGNKRSGIRYKRTAMTSRMSPLIRLDDSLFSFKFGIISPPPLTKLKKEKTKQKAIGTAKRRERSRCQIWTTDDRVHTHTHTQCV